ncbi:5'-3' exoribonuclease 2 [Stygiomarasmius scandens]|uniref:5'-3' exoribonuclease n=1 Tax=Marasmiellus scandens TaxID=2682957 RepID=A0ABR1K786_9AGAR
MGVPALFRWLSKKYPKIIYPVEEEEEVKVENENNEMVSIPTNMADPNPNGVEFDCLYLDMNGIVHPCTHPEGKPAPETEEEMMVEIFKYTERVVNMIRPRKLLFMAIDGVAPRAKMNQQRSRRFRAAQEAKEKEDARKESVLLWEAMGKEVTEEVKPAWDSNAITPGTPFMDLLATSLRYWVVQKMNTDPGWKTMQVIISDASVPGEGEHKIMDYIRRQRTNPGHDPNTRHVIYGLDADLIMLALATHEPHFRVLREDVFGESNSSACRICGQEGHYAAQCTAEKSQIQKKPPPEKKPFIFLDVSTLREYLEAELMVPNVPFNFEQAIDDWVLLIFFVGNDFLPHLPSLEIREGAIDTLLKIWKQELPRMGGYLTNHGQLELSRAQIILEGLAKREDEIFRRRREGEERQEANAKRRKLEKEAAQNDFSSGPSSALGLGGRPPIPERPTNDFAAKADSIGLGAKPTTESMQNAPAATQALAGSNHDVVANRRAIRMANMSAAEVLKAELSGLVPVKPSANAIAKPPEPAVAPVLSEPLVISQENANDVDPDEVPGLGGLTHYNTVNMEHVEMPVDEPETTTATPDEDGDKSLAGIKRKFDEGPAQDEAADAVGEDDEEPAPEASASNLEYKVNADGTVVQEDTIKLWEPGYKERYYRQKFGIELTDKETRREIAQKYVEGMAWVLCYYYQGTPSWTWYYPYHFAPFASDFEEVDKMDINFNLGQPFKPFEQLMGVFPAASRKHIPEVYHHLMTEDESPIIDFYPSTFQIDMNGKRMAWQGVALLPFIDETRLLGAMKDPSEKLTLEEIRRNAWGNNVIFASDEHPIHAFYEQLYGKRKVDKPLQIDPSISRGINGSVLPNPDCLPGSTYFCPLFEQGLPDIKNDRSLSVLYFFPKQLSPHRSVLLPGVRRPPRILSADDLEHARQGGRGRGRGRGGFDRGGPGRGRGDPFHSRPPGSYGGGGDRNYPRPNNSYQQEPYRDSYQSRPPPPHGGGYGGGGGRGRPPPNQNNGGYGGGYGGYGGYGQPAGGRGGPPNYNNHGGGYGRGGAQAGNSYGGYGGYNGGGSNGYGGGNLNGHGGQNNYGGYGGYSNNGHSNNQGYRGRGRGW